MMMAFRHLLLLLVPVSLAIDSIRSSKHRNQLATELGTGFLAEPSQELGTTSSALKAKYPWYHTSDEIHAEVQRLSTNCSNALTYRTQADSGVSINVVNMRLPATNPKNRVFILFGEHSRELISPESGLYLLRMLCGEVPVGDTSATSILQDNEFEMVLDGNPRSRSKVENGQFCLRSNPNGVDLNRNWDDMWTASAPNTDMNGGPHPFSEPETRIFKDLVTKFKPTTFLTVHSGTRGLYMPWAYDKTHIGTRNQRSMLKILKDVDKDHCQCPYGAAGKEVGYDCPGTCVDWVYDKLQTPYVFAYEIYTSPDNDVSLKKRWEEKVRSNKDALLQTGGYLGHKHFADLFRKHASDFVHVSGANHLAEHLEDCFNTFNPHTSTLYQKTVQNWAAAFLETAKRVVADMQKNKVNSTLN